MLVLCKAELAKKEGTQVSALNNSNATSNNPSQLNETTSVASELLPEGSSNGIDLQSNNNGIPDVTSKTTAADTSHPQINSEETKTAEPEEEKKEYIMPEKSYLTKIAYAFENAIHILNKGLQEVSEEECIACDTLLNNIDIKGNDLEIIRCVKIAENLISRKIAFEKSLKNRKTTQNSEKREPSAAQINGKIFSIQENIMPIHDVYGRCLIFIEEKIKKELELKNWNEALSRAITNGLTRGNQPGLNLLKGGNGKIKFYEIRFFPPNSSGIRLIGTKKEIKVGDEVINVFYFKNICLHEDINKGANNCEDFDVEFLF